MAIEWGMYPKESLAVWEKSREAIAGTGVEQQRRRDGEEYEDVDDNVREAQRSSGGRGSGIKTIDASLGSSWLMVLKNYELALVDWTKNRTKAKRIKEGGEETAAGREKRDKGYRQNVGVSQKTGSFLEDNSIGKERDNNTTTQYRRKGRRDGDRGRHNNKLQMRGRNPPKYQRGKARGNGAEKKLRT